MAAVADYGRRSIGAAVHGPGLVAAAQAVTVQQRAADAGPGRVGGGRAKKPPPFRQGLSGPGQDHIFYFRFHFLKTVGQISRLHIGNIKDG